METKKTKLFAHSNWDIVPVLAGIAHLAFVISFIIAFPHLSWPVRIFFGCIYAIAISWNINSVSHNLIHNPYFTSAKLNRAFGLIESLAIGFSQAFYHWVHMRHHSGNSDRPDENGKTIDWISIYRQGENGMPEPVLKYTFLSFFRDDPAELYRNLKKQNPAKARWGLIELSCLAFMVFCLAIYNWRAIVFIIPFYYIGHCLSYLNGYYEHFHGNPDVPIAWGVSSYNKLYNLIWFNNGYHAEHHFRPKMHWTRMKQFHEQLKEQQKKAGVHTITACHALGFLAPENR